MLRSRTSWCISVEQVTTCLQPSERLTRESVKRRSHSCSMEEKRPHKCSSTLSVSTDGSSKMSLSHEGAALTSENERFSQGDYPVPPPQLQRLFSRINFFFDSCGQEKPSNSLKRTSSQSAPNDSATQSWASSVLGAERRSARARFQAHRLSHSAACRRNLFGRITDTPQVRISGSIEEQTVNVPMPHSLGGARRQAHQAQSYFCGVRGALFSKTFLASRALWTGRSGPSWTGNACPDSVNITTARGFSPDRWAREKVPGQVA